MRPRRLALAPPQIQTISWCSTKAMTLLRESQRSRRVQSLISYWACWRMVTEPSLVKNVLMEVQRLSIVCPPRDKR